MDKNSLGLDWPAPVVGLMLGYLWPTVRYRFNADNKHVEWMGEHTAGSWAGPSCRVWLSPDVAALAMQSPVRDHAQQRKDKWSQMQTQRRVPLSGDFGIHLFATARLGDVVSLLSRTPGYNYRRCWTLSSKLLVVPFLDFQHPHGSLIALLNDIEMAIGDEFRTSVDTFDLPQHDTAKMERRCRGFTSLVIVDVSSPMRIWMIRDCTDTVLYELEQVQAAVNRSNPWSR